MAKYTVTFSCGHTDTVELFGKDSDRERKIEYFKEQGICPHCYKESLEAKKAEGCDEDLIINAYRNADSLTRDMVKRCLGISAVDDTDETVNKIVRKVSRKKDSGIPNSAVK